MPSPIGRSPDCRTASRMASTETAEDLLGVVLDPAGLRKVLGELAVAAAEHGAVLVDDERGRSGGALVEREDGRHQSKVRAELAGREHAAVGDERGHQLGRRHVERGIPDLHPVGGDAMSAPRGDLVGRPLLDRNRGPGRRGGIDRGARREHVERHAVRARGERQPVGADLVGEVAVGRDAVGPDDHAGDVAPRGAGSRSCRPR